MHVCLPHAPALLHATTRACRSCACVRARREELAALNRSIQATAKGIKAQLEGLSRDRGAMPEPQQAKLRKLMQDFAAALQVCVAACARAVVGAWRQAPAALMSKREAR